MVQRAKQSDSGHQARAKRIHIRATSRQRTVIEQAAEISGKNISAFLLDAGCNEAERTLAKQQLFLLDREKWEQFSAALERPVIEKPRLRALMRTPGLLD